MSSNGGQRFEDENNIDETEAAFIDLEDPDLQVLDDGENEGEHIASDDEGDDQDIHNADDNENEEDENGDEEADGAPQQDTEVEDLNAVPDRVPERDDAVATFASPGLKPIHAVAVNPQNPSIVAAAGEGEEIYILELSAGEAEASPSFNLLHTLKGHGDTVSLLSFSPNGQWLASGSLDSTVGLWSTSTWERVHSLTDHYGEIMCLLWHPSSLVLVTGGDDAQAAMWNVTKGTLAMYFVGHRGPVTCCVWSRDFKKLVTGSSDGSVSVYNPKTGEQEININKDLSPDNAGVTTLAFVSEDQCLVGCEDGTLHVISMRGGKVVTHLEDLHEQAIESLQVNDNSALVISSSCDCKVIIWNVTDFSARAVLEVGESVIPACWAQDVLVVAGCSDGDVRVWDGRSAAQEPLAALMGHRRMVLSLAVAGKAPNSTFICTGADDGAVKCFPVPMVSHTQN